MINLDSIIGDVIFISFRNIDRLKNIGITESIIKIYSEKDNLKQYGENGFKYVSLDIFLI